jgi:hypothetical protein
MVTVSTFMATVSRITKSYIVIVTHIWQKLSNIEREVTLIVTHFWRLFSRIFGETSLIVTHIWQNQTCFAQVSCGLPESLAVSCRKCSHTPWEFLMTLASSEIGEQKLVSLPMPVLNFPSMIKGMPC